MTTDADPPKSSDKFLELNVRLMLANGAVHVATVSEYELRW